jgi:hypothetical protein
MLVSCSREAAEILDSLQIQAEARFPVEALKTKQDVKEMIERNIRHSSFKDLFPDRHAFNIIESVKLPTAHEDPVYYILVSDMLGELVKTAQAMKYPLPPSVAVGTVCTAHVNAHVIPIGISKSEYLLVFNRHVFRFAHLFSNFIAHCVISEFGSLHSHRRMQHDMIDDSSVVVLERIIYDLVNTPNVSRDKDGSIKSIMLFDRGGRGISRDVLAHLGSLLKQGGTLTNVVLPYAQAMDAAFAKELQGDQLIGPPLFELTTAGEELRGLLMCAINLFTIAHELGHLILEIDAKEAMSPSGKRSIFWDEMTCDAIGCRLALHTMARLCRGQYRDGWQRIGAMGALFFLSSWEIVDCCAFVMDNGTEMPIDSKECDLRSINDAALSLHPPTTIRKKMVAEIVCEELKQIGQETLNWTFEAWDWTDQSYERCLKILIPIFKRHFKDRRRVEKQVKRTEGWANRKKQLDSLLGWIGRALHLPAS